MFQCEGYSDQWVMPLDPVQLVVIAHIYLTVFIVIVMPSSIYVT